MSQMALVAMLFQLCGTMKMDCSDVAILEIPNTNVIYVANCKPIYDKEGYAHYLGINRGFHYIGDKLHHLLIINNSRCQKT